MTLRRRALIATGTGLGVILLGFILVITSFASVSGAQSKLNDLLTPAAQMANSLLLAQTAASGDLSDYVLTGKEAPLASHQSAISTTNVMISNLIVHLWNRRTLNSPLSWKSRASARTGLGER